MNAYQIPGNNVNLNPLAQKNFPEFLELLENPGIIEASLLYNNLYNFVYSYSDLEQALENTDFSLNNRLYLVLEKDNQQVIGLVGLVDIDWIMKRCELLIIMDRECRRQRMIYEPVKLLLHKGIKEWNLNRITARIDTGDVVSTTVLKSFGFKVVGELKDYMKLKDDFLGMTSFFLKGEEVNINQYTG